jgi:hypothetical protein
VSDNFLSRWSRRKQQVRQTEELFIAPPTEAVDTAAPIRPSQAEAPLTGGERGEGGLTPEEIAALPPVESLTAEADITMFLRKGVPEFLRNAALRRIWSLDPSIRDYVGEALDYAYDWNVQGGVPGNGPLLPSDDVAAMVHQVFHGAEPQPEAITDGVDLSEPEPDLGSVRADAERDCAAIEEGAERSSSMPPQDCPTLQNASIDQPEAGETTPAADDSGPTTSGRAGRHGGATPH